MNEESLQLDIPVLLPEIPDARDLCVSQLEAMLKNHRGVRRVHIKYDVEPAQLCLHFDPNLISLAAVRRMAHQAGAELTERYQHDRIPIAGLTVADAAEALADELEALDGMVHASVSYAAGLAFVAYDAKSLTDSQIEDAISRAGYRIATRPTAGMPADAEASRPQRPLARLPRWLQARWRLLLVGAAGLLFLIGWLGATLFGLATDTALIFYTLAYLAAGFDLARHAVPGLLKGRFDTDVLMLSAALGAALLGEWAEGAFLLFLFGLGHAGEHYALNRARRAVNALGQLMPRTARMRLNGSIIEVAVEQLQVGDVVVVRPGDRIPADGQICQGKSTVDQSAITGESVPVNKAPGDDVFAGTVNQDNALEVQVTQPAKDNTLSRVMQMVAEAQEQRSPTQQFTQRFTAKFVPAVLLLVILVMVVPPLFGWMSWPDSVYRGLLLLVAASPCALAIGTPAAVLAAIAQAARQGVLIKGGVHLENLGRLRVMAFDKTGTLTEGAFTVTDIVPLNGVGPDELLRLAGAVEQQANHPLAAAVVRAARQRELALPAVRALENISGKGVRAQIGEQTILVGTLELVESTTNGKQDKLTQTVQRLTNAGKTTMAVSRGGHVLGVLALTDTPRPGVGKTLQALLVLGFQKLVMLTGDRQAVAEQVGREVGVTDVRAELLPEEKLQAIEHLQQQHGAIAMVGDGVNDAPALATATVGIAMGGAGTAVALETADVALMADDLAKLPFAVGLSRASRAIIQQNLAIALGVIALLIVTSVLGLVPLSGAVVLHEGSTILVVLNALRLLRYQEKSN